MIEFKNLSPEAQRAVDDYIISEFEFSHVEWGFGVTWKEAGRTMSEIREEVAQAAESILMSYEQNGPRSCAFSAHDRLLSNNLLKNKAMSSVAPCT